MEWYFNSLYIILIISVIAVLFIKYLKDRESNCTVPVEAIITTCVRKSTGKWYGYFSVYKFTYNDERYNVISMIRRSEFKGLIEYGKKVIIYIDPMDPNIIRESISIKDFVKLNPFMSSMFFIVLLMVIQLFIG